MISSFDSGQQEMIHDAQFDYFGKRVATASSDRTVRVFDVAENRQALVVELRGYEGPVWQVAWSHPKFGNLLASCAYDGRVIIWKEDYAGWRQVLTSLHHQSSVNTVAWAPYTFGAVIAAGSADGSISLFTSKGEVKWDRVTFEAHKGGVNSVSWAPDARSSVSYSSSRFVSGGCDNQIQVWRLDPSQRSYVRDRFQNDDNTHKDWVRDVAWAPSATGGLLPAQSLIASASEDKTVILWTEDSKSGLWKKHQIMQFPHKVWRVSWSAMGNTLAITQGDGQVSLWKQSHDSQWVKLSEPEKEKREGKAAG